MNIFRESEAILVRQADETVRKNGGYHKPLVHCVLCPKNKHWVNIDESDCFCVRQDCIFRVTVSQLENPYPTASYKWTYKSHYCSKPIKRIDPLPPSVRRGRLIVNSDNCMLCGIVTRSLAGHHVFPLHLQRQLVSSFSVTECASMLNLCYDCHWEIHRVLYKNTDKFVSICNELKTVKPKFGLEEIKEVYGKLGFRLGEPVTSKRLTSIVLG